MEDTAVFANSKTNQSKSMNGYTHANGFHKKTLNGVNGIIKHGFASDPVVKQLKENANLGLPVPPIDWASYDTRKGTFEECSVLTAFMTHFGFYILMILGFINKLLFKPKVATEKNRQGYAPLYNTFDQFYSNYVYRRVRDCWNRPICSAPGAELTLKDRVTDDHCWTFRFTGTETRCVNLGSYNYLGFASGEGECADAAVEAVRKYGLTLGSSRAELGTCELHRELEQTMAKFLGVEDAVVFGMGFATNSLGIPALLGPDCLALSDERNHASLILGLRLARTTVKVFHHNDVRHLERLVRSAIMEQKFRKIVIVVEGVYSMEGSVVPLPAIVAIAKRYGCSIYLDEAHSIGAMGPRGKGITDMYGIDPTDIDVMMGTFTKSFGAAGGYVAGTKALVSWVRAHGHATSYAHSMSPPVAQQILSSMRAATWNDRVKKLKENSRYFRQNLREMGVIAFGHDDSPVVPMLVYKYSKIGSTVRWLTECGVAVVGVGFPATPLMEGRIRFCISAAHTREQLDKAIKHLREAADNLGLRQMYSYFYRGTQQSYNGMSKHMHN